MQRRHALTVSVALAVTGTVGAVVVAVAASGSDPAPQTRGFGSGVATSLAQTPSTAPTTTPSSSPPGTRPASTRPAPPRAPSPSRSTPAPPPTPAAAAPVPVDSGGGPSRIAIPAAGIAASVEPVGVTDDGDVEIPEDVRVLGWYRYSPNPPASAGSTVVVGHVDSAEQGTGAFFTLHDLKRGDRVYLSSASGKRLTYRVVASEAFPKTSVPLAALFSRTGAPRLTLITCGGSFDSSARSYRDNIVVTAVPA